MLKQKRMHGKRVGRYSSWQHLRHHSPSPERPRRPLTDPISRNFQPSHQSRYIYIDIYLRGSFCSPRFSEKNLRRENDKFYYAVDPSRKFFRFFILSCYFCSSIYFEKVSRDIISRKFRNLSFQVEPSARFNRIGDKLCSNFSILV